jgi:hypothetical protein
MSQLKKFVAQRTDKLDQVLRELWALRPELYKRNSVIVYLGALALLDEARNTKKQMPASADENLEPCQDSFHVSEAADMSDGAAASEPHPDSAWNF